MSSAKKVDSIVFHLLKVNQSSQKKNWIDLNFFFAGPIWREERNDADWPTARDTSFFFFEPVSQPIVGNGFVMYRLIDLERGVATRSRCRFDQTEDPFPIETRVHFRFEGSRIAVLLSINANRCGVPCYGK